jgi:hypothetical protein
VTGVLDGAVAGEMGEELHHRDLRTVFGGEPGEAIGALSRAASTGNPDDDVRVGGEEIRARLCQEHNQNTWTREGRRSLSACVRDRSRRRRRGSGSVHESAVRAVRGNAASPAVRPAAFGFAPRQKRSSSCVGWRFPGRRSTQGEALERDEAVCRRGAFVGAGGAAAGSTSERAAVFAPAQAADSPDKAHTAG